MRRQLGGWLVPDGQLASLRDRMRNAIDGEVVDLRAEASSLRQKPAVPGEPLSEASKAEIQAVDQRLDVLSRRFGSMTVAKTLTRPLHGAEVARALGIPEVIVPAYPGITSAVGLLTTDLKYDAVRTEFQAGNTVDLDRLDTDLAGMQRELTRQLAADGIAPDDAVFERSGDLRYVGQGYELRVPFPDGKLDQAALAQIFARFVELHRAEYGHVFEASPIEIVNVRVTGIGRMPKIAAPRPTRGGSLVEALVKTARCVFRHNGALERLATPFYRRNLLPLEEPIAGPAIVLQTDSTTVVPPGTTLVPEVGGNLILTIDQ